MYYWSKSNSFYCRHKCYHRILIFVGLFSRNHSRKILCSQFWCNCCMRGNVELHLTTYHFIYIYIYDAVCRKCQTRIVNRKDGRLSKWWNELLSWTKFFLMIQWENKKWKPYGRQIKILFFVCIVGLLFYAAAMRRIFSFCAFLILCFPHCIFMNSLLIMYRLFFSGLWWSRLRIYDWRHCCYSWTNRKKLCSRNVWRHCLYSWQVYHKHYREELSRLRWRRPEINN